MKKSIQNYVIGLGLLTLSLLACKKSNPTLGIGTNDSTTHYYVTSVISPDSASHTVNYYYDSNHNLLGARTDSTDDSLIYSNNQIASSYRTHLSSGVVDTLNFVYDGQGRISQIMNLNRKTGISYKFKSFVYDGNNNLTGDSVFKQIQHSSSSVVLTTLETRTVSNGNTTSVSTQYQPGYLKYYAGASPDSITNIVTNYTFDANPNSRLAWPSNAKIALGYYNFNQNNVLTRTVIATGKINPNLYTYVFTNVYSYDSKSQYPISDAFSSSGGANQGPFTLNLNYSTVITTTKSQ